MPAAIIPNVHRDCQVPSQVLAVGLPTCCECGLRPGRRPHSAATPPGPQHGKADGLGLGPTVSFQPRSSGPGGQRPEASGPKLLWSRPGSPSVTVWSQPCGQIFRVKQVSAAERKMANPSIGFWEPHTSSIDFCEPNYLITKYIAEPHNAFSSLAITVFGLIGLICGNPTQEMRFRVMYSIFAFVGVGSFALHTTLDWFTQSLDEVPMLWVNLTYLYALVEMEKPKAFENGKQARSLEWFFLAFAIFQTAIYFWMRSLYLFFVVTYTATAAVVTLWSGYWALSKKRMPEQDAICRMLFLRSISCYIVIGCVVWLLDMRR